MKVIIFLLLIIASTNVFAIGEKYSEEGHAVAGKLFEILAENGVCPSPSECNKKSFLFGEHGDRVNLNFYGITDRKIISEIVRYASQNGLVITRGVPITIRFFEKPKSELLGIKAFTTDPAIKIEVNN